MTMAYCITDLVDNSLARASASVFRSKATNVGGLIKAEAMDGSYSDLTRS